MRLGLSLPGTGPVSEMVDQARLLTELLTRDLDVVDCSLDHLQTDRAVLETASESRIAAAVPGERIRVEQPWSHQLTAFVPTWRCRSHPVDPDGPALDVAASTVDASSSGLGARVTVDYARSLDGRRLAAPGTATRRRSPAVGSPDADEIYGRRVDSSDAAVDRYIERGYLHVLSQDGGHVVGNAAQARRRDQVTEMIRAAG